MNLSFFDLAKNYIRIKGVSSERSLDDKELKQVKKIQQMMDKGYELRLLRLRKGSTMVWYKKNC